MSGAADTLLARYGTDEPPAGYRVLRAGGLAVDFEGGQLRYLRWHGIEVLRAISFLVRDDHWGTFAAGIDGLRIAETEARFEIDYRARCAPGAGDFVFEARIIGEASGRLHFAVAGTPDAELRTNRTGFVVLHPLAGIVGRAMEVTHTDGRIEAVVVPEAIDPREPIKDIFALTHEPAAGLSARVEMTGDAYDMEDQRNWTDASLKSYVRPLSKPWPYTLAAGEPVAQSITVTIAGTAAGAARPIGTAALRTARTAGEFPRLGLCVEGQDVPETLRRLQAVREIGAGRLIGRARSTADLFGFARLREGLDLPLTLELAIPAIDPARELEAWAEAADEAGLKPQSVLATPFRLYPLRPEGTAMGDASLAEIARGCRAAFPDAEIGGGVLAGFPEFNRNRPPVEAVDFVSHTTSAIVHAADDRSVLESLETLPYTLASARAIAPEKPYRLGPSGIGLGLNPDGPPRWRGPGEGRRTMVRNDPRHAALFGAAWTLGYAARTAALPVELTLSHAVGDFGAIGPKGELRPIYHVLRGLARGTGRKLVTAETGEPEIAGIGFAGRDGDEIWLANLSPRVHTLARRPASFASIGAADIEAAARDPGFLDRLRPLEAELTLAPFAIARLVLG